AKKLERMKSTNPRFKQANQLIDSKLDNLFQKQESMKAVKNKVRMKNGGKLAYADGGFAEIDPIKEFMRTRLFDRAEFMPNTPSMSIVPRELPKLNYNLPGGILDELTVIGDRIPGFRPNPIGDLSSAFNTTRSAYDKFHNEIFNLDQTPQSAFSFQPEGERQFLSTSQLRKIGVGASAFIPNIANAILQRGLKGPQAPQMENKVSLQRVTPDAALAANTRDFRGAQKLLTSNTAQGSNLASS